MFPHLLQGDSNAHLCACNRYHGIEEVEIRQLAIYAVVDDVDRLEAVVKRVVDYDCALKRAALKGQRVNRRGLVGVVIGVDPGLGSGLTIWCYDEDYVFGP